MYTWDYLSTACILYLWIHFLSVMHVYRVTWVHHVYYIYVYSTWVYCMYTGLPEYSMYINICIVPECTACIQGYLSTACILIYILPECTACIQGYLSTACILIYVYITWVYCMYTGLPPTPTTRQPPFCHRSPLMLPPRP